MRWLAVVWNNSLGTKGYVSTCTLKDMEWYGFENIKLMGCVAMKMKSSGHSHNHYLYKRIGDIVPYNNQCDPILEGVWKTFNDERDAVIAHNLNPKLQGKYKGTSDRI